MILVKEGKIIKIFDSGIQVASYMLQLGYSYIQYESEDGEAIGVYASYPDQAISGVKRCKVKILDA